MKTISKTKHALCGLLLLAAAPNSPAAHPQVSIDSSTWAGLTLPGNISGISSTGLIIGTGVPGSALKTSYATIDGDPATFGNQNLTLGIGETLAYTATITLEGITPAGPTTSYGDQFRISLLDFNGSTNRNGWLGYTASNSDKFGGLLHERNNPNSSGFGTLFGPSAPATVIQNNFLNGSIRFGDGTYTVSYSLARSAAGITITASMKRGTVEFMGHSFLDTTPQTVNFNRIAVGLHSLTNASRATISDAALTLTPQRNHAPAASFTSASAPVFHCTSLDAATGSVTINVGDADNDPLTAIWSVNATPVATHVLAPGATSDTLVNQLFGFAPSTLSVSVTDGKSKPVILTTTVTVADHEQPAPAVASLPTLTGECSVTITSAPTAWDDCAFGDPAGLIIGTTTDPLTYTAQGTYIVTWKYTDPHDAAVFTLQEQVVKVEDVTPPEVSCPPAVSVAYGAVPAAATTPAEFIAQGGTITDHCDPNANGTVASEDVTEGICPIIVTRTYRVTDAAGNAAYCPQIITVENLFAADGLLWHQPLARNGASEDTDPSADGTLNYRFKLGRTIPIKIHARGCAGNVTGNANVSGKVVVFGDTDIDGVADADELAIDFNGVGEAGGVMDKIDGHLRYNLDTKKLPPTFKCYILQVTVTDDSTGETTVETIPLQSK